MNNRARMFPMEDAGSGEEPLKTSTSSAVDVLLKKGKREAAAYIHSECTRDRETNPQLKELLDFLLDPSKPLEDWELTDWCRWLLAAGKNPDEFAKAVRLYDCATTCGLVWTANFVAYRCRTCSISPCMSLCSDCFRKGNHEGHDFNMFKSLSGGACDCGDTTVMRESGFCNRHGPNAQVRNVPSAPKDLLCVAEAMMPRIILRLIQHLREQSEMPDKDNNMVYTMIMQEADGYLDMLHSLSDMGTAMRKVMTSVLTNPSIYQNQTQNSSGDEKYREYMNKSQTLYETAVGKMAVASFSEAELMKNDYPWVQKYYEILPRLKTMAGFDEKLKHRTFLDELVFWTVRYHFPQKLVCLLLNMLPDHNYKEAFTRAFVLHYNRVSRLLRSSPHAETLCTRVVHVSVQLYSNETLTLKMADEMGLLHIMVMSLNAMMMGLLCPAVDKTRVSRKCKHHAENRHRVLDCTEFVIKEHCYWPLVSDLNSMLTHRPVALRFVDDKDDLMYWWFLFVSMFQGMNVNYRELNEYVEYELNTYFAAFTAELEAIATPMWALAAHFVTPDTLDVTKAILKSCSDAIRQWMEDTGTAETRSVCLLPGDEDQVSFHLPLHRFFAVFMAQAVRYQNGRPQDLLPPDDLLDLMIVHPLRIHVAFYEIFSGLWVRNGLQIKGQASSYVQCHYCNSLVDPDLYLLQLGAMVFNPDEYILRVLNSFHLFEWLDMFPSDEPKRYGDKDQQMSMVESCLIFLATLVSLRANVGLSEKDLQRLEIVTLLCMGEKTHSQLVDLMPEKGGGSNQNRDFEEILEEVACYKAPNFESGSGTMQQGMYAPKPEAWEELFDPIYVLLRAVHRKDFQASLDRFTAFVKLSGKYKCHESPWPPFRIPTPPKWGYPEPIRILQSKSFQAVLFALLFHALEDSRVTEHVLSLTIYLLDLVVTFAKPVEHSSIEVAGVSASSTTEIEVPDGDYESWFETDNVSANLRCNIRAIYKYVPVSFRMGDAMRGAEAAAAGEDGDVEDQPEEQPNDGLQVDVAEEDDGEYGADGDYEGTVGEVVEVLSQEAGAEGDGVYLRGLGLSSGSGFPAVTAPPEDMETSEEGAVATVPPARAVAPPNLQASSANYVQSWLIAQANYMSAVQPAPIQPPVCDDSLPICTSLSRRAVRGPQRLALLAGNELGRHGEREKLQVMSFRKHSVPLSHGLLQRMLSAGRPVRLPIEGPKAAAPQEGPVHSKVSVAPSYSIISLLLRLHSKLSGKPDSYEPLSSSPEPTSATQGPAASGPFVPDPEGRIGNGPFFIKKVLDKICRLDLRNIEHIEQMRRVLWPRAKKEEEEERARQLDREERRRKARERQQKLMAEFATKQRQFMEKTKENAESMDTEMPEVHEPPRESEETENESVIKTYDCGICGQSAPTTEESPMGLVVLVQPTSVTGHRQRNTVNLELPVSDNEDKVPSITETVVKKSLAAEMMRRTELLKGEFDKAKWISAVSFGFRNGIHVQTCGHLLHIECHKLYMDTLMSGMLHRSQIVDYKGGEFTCPLCRQLASIVLPIVPAVPTYSPPLPVFPSGREPDQSDYAEALINFYGEMTPEPLKESIMSRSVKGFMAAITGGTHTHKTVDYLGSVLRTNFEADLIARNGHIVGNQDVAGRRSCYGPMLRVISTAKFAEEVTAEIRARSRLLTGKCLIDDMSVAISEAKEVPLLLHDPVTLLFSHLVVPPLCDDRAFFLSFVKTLFTLSYVQNLTAAIILMTKPCREEFRSYVNDDGRIAQCTAEESLSVTNIKELGRIVLQSMGVTYLIPFEQTRQDDETRHDLSSVEAVNRAIKAGLMQLLRLSSLVNFHVFEDPLPTDIRGESDEFDKLCDYLRISVRGGGGDREASPSGGVGFAGSGSDDDIARRLQWAVTNPEKLVETWVKELVVHVDASGPFTSRRILIQHQLFWEQPRLLQLPHEYLSIFRVYHAATCSNCNLVPKDPAICLICGTLVCMKESCCKLSACEAVTHSQHCGAGTCIYLAVNSSLVVVIRGRRACLWGSCYLDAFGEEDRDLKRGKPLYLSKERYKLLEKQWKTHGFDHTAKRWVWHKDHL